RLCLARRSGQVIRVAESRRRATRRRHVPAERRSAAEAAAQRSALQCTAQEDGPADGLIRQRRIRWWSACLAGGSATSFSCPKKTARGAAGGSSIHITRATARSR